MLRERENKRALDTFLDSAKERKGKEEASLLQKKSAMRALFIDVRMGGGEKGMWKYLILL